MLVGKQDNRVLDRRQAVTTQGKRKAMTRLRIEIAIRAWLYAGVAIVALGHLGVWEYACSHGGIACYTISKARRTPKQRPSTKRLQVPFPSCSKTWALESQLSSRAKYGMYARSACYAKELVDTLRIYAWNTAESRKLRRWDYIVLYTKHNHGTLGAFHWQMIDADIDVGWDSEAQYVYTVLTSEAASHMEALCYVQKGWQAQGSCFGALIVHASWLLRKAHRHKWVICWYWW